MLASRRSSAQNAPPEFVPSSTVSTPTVGPVSQPTSQTSYAYDDSNIAMIAAIDCGLDVRPLYGDPRQIRGSDDVRGSYYTNSQPPASSHYHVGPILPSHFPHVSPSFPHNQSAVGGPVRRVSTFADGRMLYNTNPPVSDPTTRTNYSGIPINSYSLQHHNHEGAPTPSSAWSHTTVDSVRDSVSPYTRPRPGEHGGGRNNNCPTNNSTASNASSRLGPTSAANMPGGMQYNAQGRPLAYICNTCMRAFDRPSALQIHERSHTGERPFPCPWNGCIKRFTTHFHFFVREKNSLLNQIHNRVTWLSILESVLFENQKNLEQ
ncbi:uncharacterized protein MELLADRAFT_77951 [Melampsora larici-populina 98AG31]|uniref:C2H2-type domain-containing protein n=1 Tax=Melampsora larici-populina (strain 98AG31 / pathotype 3-4-7) TaxID=747676 RepID=F4RNP7_MELLP|nr:uncharacterized protein MELLADRAFT_77951 [Melampsora larici-populina 98AG31]EGG06058.1 hypothetical protein MELLADRAFT_77951 [Melampsora larici-populina 98AG31]